MRSRVDRVALKLRVPETERARVGAIRTAVERVMLQAALDELERVIHDRLGEAAIVRVRRLAVRWQLDEAALTDSMLACELGRDLARALLADVDAMPRPQRLRPPSSANVVVFTDADHHLAAVLADRAEHRSEWFHEPISDAIAAWTELEQVPARRAAVERWLERMERVAEVQTWLAGELGIMTGGVGVHPRPRAASGEPAPATVRARREDSAELVEASGESPQEMAHDDDARCEPLAAPAPAIATTDHAGAWYLARLVGELGIAEALWAAGAREGDVLAHVVLAVLGREAARDPVARWFGGCFEHMPELEALAGWAVEEVLAAIPVPPKALVTTCTYVAPNADRATEQLVASAAASVVARFCARLEIAPDLGRVRAYLAVPGQMQLEGDRITVTMPMQRVDIDLRRAGIDFDPGYVPWTARTVELVFAD